jgi:hypothetical protein
VACVRTLFSAALCSLAACTVTDAADGWVGRTDTLGDTIVVTTVSGAAWGDRSPVVVESVTTLWRSDSLARPQLIVRNGDELLVTEATRIWRLRGDGTLAGAFGRSGEGPGEFRRIIGVGVVPGDTILVLDAMGYRLSRFDAGGRLIGDAILERPDGANNVFETFRLVPAAGAISVFGLGLMRTDGAPSEFVLARVPLDGGTPTEVARVAGPTMKVVGDGALALADLFGPYPTVTVGADGRVAVADRVDYCIAIDSAGARPKRICRDYDRVPVTDAVRSPDLSALSESDREGLAAVIAASDPGTYRHALTHIRLAGDGRLWVRVVDSAQANLHPFLAGLTGEPPPRYIWDVFDRDGRRLGEVHLPSAFDPREFAGDTIYGVEELDTGELTIATVVLPEGL